MVKMCPRRDSWFQGAFGLETKVSNLNIASPAAWIKKQQLLFEGGSPCLYAWGS